LKGWNWQGRTAAAEVLGEIGDSSAVEPLAILEGEDESVRRAAAKVPLIVLAFSYYVSQKLIPVYTTFSETNSLQRLTQNS